MFIKSMAASAWLLGCSRAQAQTATSAGTHLEATTSSGMAYRVFLPPEYDEGSDTNYSVLFHLHGAGASWTNVKHDVEAVAALTTTAKDAGVLDPMIIVAPHDETGWSMWADSHDGSSDLASQILTELIPEVDSSFRTWPVPECRVIQGFSMGGFGAATMLFKHPELFGAGIVWDGAMHDWSTLSANRANVAADQFGSSEQFFERWSPWKLAAESQDQAPPFMMVKGSLDAFYDRYSSHLIQSGHEPTLVDGRCGHDMACLAESVGDQAAAFLAEVLI